MRRNWGDCATVNFFFGLTLAKRKDCLATHGMEARCAGIVALDLSLSALGSVKEIQADALIAFANQRA
jgi:hypothetical protein